jgi:hypothetical protein
MRKLISWSLLVASLVTLVLGCLPNTTPAAFEPRSYRSTLRLGPDARSGGR